MYCHFTRLIKNNFIRTDKSESKEDSNIAPFLIHANGVVDGFEQTVTSDEVYDDTDNIPPDKCYACKGTEFGRNKNKSGGWVCGKCHPPASSPDEIEWLTV